MAGKARKRNARGRESDISKHECRAMQSLDADDSYSRSEIAFMFECKVPTVSQHCQRDCAHFEVEMTMGRRRGDVYSDEDLLFAFGWVRGLQPYERMSTTVYDDYAGENFPAANTISDRLDGWREARRRVKALLGGGD